MAFRFDIPSIVILATEFQAFDHGAQISIEIPEAYGLQTGDLIYWNLAQFSGTAEIISRNGTECIIEKRS